MVVQLPHIPGPYTAQEILCDCSVTLFVSTFVLSVLIGGFKVIPIEGYNRQGISNFNHTQALKPSTLCNLIFLDKNVKIFTLQMQC